jgi:hypothetical protein
MELLQGISYPPVFVDGELWYISGFFLGEEKFIRDFIRFGRGQFSLAYTLEFPDGQSWQFLR